MMASDIHEGEVEHLQNLSVEDGNKPRPSEETYVSAKHERGDVQETYELTRADLKWNIMLGMMILGGLLTVGLYFGDVHWTTPAGATLLGCIVLGWGDLREIASGVISRVR